jgi:antitoxin ParD1/3/4
MTHLTITLPEAVKDYIDRQVSDGIYSTADDFLMALIEQERQAKQKVNAILRSTIQNSKTIEAIDDWWEQQLQYLTEQLPPQT